MILQFMRLFRPFSDLELAVASLRAENEALEKLVEASNDEALSQSALAGQAAARVEDLKRMVDAYSMRVDRRYVFSQVEVVAPPQQSVPPVPARRLGRDVVRDGERDFAAQMAELYREHTEVVLKQAE